MLLPACLPRLCPLGKGPHQESHALILPAMGLSFSPAGRGLPSCLVCCHVPTDA